MRSTIRDFCATDGSTAHRHVANQTQLRARRHLWSSRSATRTKCLRSILLQASMCPAGVALTLQQWWAGDFPLHRLSSALHGFRVIPEWKSAVSFVAGLLEQVVSYDILRPGRHPRLGGRSEPLLLHFGETRSRVTLDGKTGKTASMGGSAVQDCGATGFSFRSCSGLKSILKSVRGQDAKTISQS